MKNAVIKAIKVRKSKNIQNIFGIDEVGRGPLAGPVYVCAVKMSKAFYKKFCYVTWQKKYFKKLNLKYYALRDSKKLNDKQKDVWDIALRNLHKEGLLDFYIASRTAKQIDRLGIANCIKESVAECLNKLSATCTDVVKLDGALSAPAEYTNQETIIKGDDLIPAISAASILAKVSRDEYMKNLSRKSKELGIYEFEQNKGYGTLLHRQAIKKFGLSNQHRKSYCLAFKPKIR